MRGQHSDLRTNDYGIQFGRELCLSMEIHKRSGTPVLQVAFAVILLPEHSRTTLDRAFEGFAYDVGLVERSGAIHSFLQNPVPSSNLECWHQPSHV